jgi:hypothetical protein
MIILSTGPQNHPASALLHRCGGAASAAGLPLFGLIATDTSSGQLTCVAGAALQQTTHLQLPSFPSDAVTCTKVSSILDILWLVSAASTTRARSLFFQCAVTHEVPQSGRSHMMSHSVVLSCTGTRDDCCVPAVICTCSAACGYAATGWVLEIERGDAAWSFSTTVLWP